jgi:hypothetical protein
VVPDVFSIISLILSLILLKNSSIPNTIDPERFLIVFKIKKGDSK